jgi:hypothetical protein
MPMVVRLNLNIRFAYYKKGQLARNTIYIYMFMDIQIAQLEIQLNM